MGPDLKGPETVPGQGPIPRPDAPYNPAAEPITSSPLDFTELVGGDMDTPRNASSLRPDREWIEFQQRKVFSEQAPLAGGTSAHRLPHTPSHSLTPLPHPTTSVNPHLFDAVSKAPLHHQSTDRIICDRMQHASVSQYLCYL